MIFRYCGNILVSMQSYFRILNGEIAPRVLNCLTISLYPKNDLPLNFGHNEDLRKSPQHMNNKGAKKEEQVYFPLTLTRQMSVSACNLILTMPGLGMYFLWIIARYTKSSLRLNNLLMKII